MGDYIKLIGYWSAFSLIISCGSVEDPEPDDMAMVGNAIGVRSSVDTVSEGTGTVPLMITIDEAINEDLLFSLSFSGTATFNMDYEKSSNSTIQQGAISTTVNLNILDDMVAEDSETILIRISTPSSSGIVLGKDSIEVLLIEDNDIKAGECTNDNSIDQNNFECDQSPGVDSFFNEDFSGNLRIIEANGVPTHDFRIQIEGLNEINAEIRTYRIEASPKASGMITNITNENGEPEWVFGIALNGVKMDPAPHIPFAFELPSGAFNFDWFFEPTNNMEALGLDCAIGHFQPDGQYHYHGDMAIYADQLLAGLGTGSTEPDDVVQIGWAADGYPILYKYGPDINGVLKELKSSYQLKEGERPGDGVNAPCGPYNGKYAADYEYIRGSGNLDQCNGMAQTIMLNEETFNYFYVITEDFPVISRCFIGSPGDDFKIGM